MADRHVYVVMGLTSGEHGDDLTEWPVAAFFHHEAANQRVRDLVTWLTGQGCRPRRDQRGLLRPTNYLDLTVSGPSGSLRTPLDPSMPFIDSWGIVYRVLVVPAIGDLPDEGLLTEWTQARAIRLTR